MDRQIVFAGQIPLDTDLLNTERYVQIGFGMAMQAILGTSTVVDGLACTQNAPTSLTVLVGPGSLYSVQNTDGSAFGSLTADVTHSIVKQGILYDTQTIACPAPGTAGQSINYLIQVAFSEVDDTPIVLPYYNSANPAVAFSGPGGAGTSQNTARRDKVVVTAKAGVSATTGSQTTPSPDAGNAGLYVVTVANGQSSITNSNISTLVSAPFITAKLPAVPAATQNGSWVYGADTGAVNAMVLTLNPPITSYVAGQSFEIKVGNTNTGAVTLNVNGIGAKSVVRGDGTALQAGDIGAGTFLYVSYDGTNFQVVAKSSALDTIDTAISRTVYGGGADFADLNAAFAWLSRRRIGQNGSVTLNCSSGKWTSATTQLLYHPDAARVTINGANMSGGLAYASFTLTGFTSGQRASDNSANLTYLRSKYATELSFTGGAGIIVQGVGPTFDQLLLSGDGTTTNGNQLLLVRNGSATLNRVSAHGHGYCGIQVTQGYILTPVGGFVSSTGNSGSGITSFTGGAIYNNGTMLSFSNGSDGFTCSYSSAIAYGGTTSLFYASGNVTSGFAASWNSTIALYPGTSSRSSYNGAYGFLAQMSSSVQAQASQSFSNGNYGYYALTNSTID